MNSINKLSTIIMIAVALSTATLFTALMTIPSANADSSTDQSAQKYDKKCDKATVEESAKKGRQADAQYEHHDPDATVVCTSG
jgi:hypothetical protein